MEKPAPMSAQEEEEFWDNYESEEDARYWDSLSSERMD